ncbi:hypothetical protein [Falsiroseomonas tokyonensis]|uniref:Uncharacterized protein n=1 Tax=Falsiroseomonas tokyonensis TaxID=430521 RepID=A0ABV7BVF1_9PROT|nr:hypothetical protein [Falsiroseomonas tokyonensis]MBU8539490.1 hypothetical protein [Falsiroseomonas tokyonensis]
MSAVVIPFPKVLRRLEVTWPAQPAHPALEALAGLPPDMRLVAAFAYLAGVSRRPFACPPLPWGGGPKPPKPPRKPKPRPAT